MGLSAALTMQLQLAAAAPTNTRFSGAPVFAVNLLQRLNVLADKGDGHRQQAAHAVACQLPASVEAQ